MDDDFGWRGAQPEKDPEDNSSIRICYNMKIILLWNFTPRVSNTNHTVDFPIVLRVPNQTSFIDSL